MASQGGVTELRSRSSGRDSNAPPPRVRRALYPITAPPRPAAGPARLELAMLPLHHGLRTDDPDRTGIFGLATRRSSLLSYVRVERLAGIEPASFAFARQRSSAELQACEKPPAGIEPAPRPYKGRVLAVDTTEARAPVARALPLGRRAPSCARRRRPPRRPPPRLPA